MSTIMYKCSCCGSLAILPDRSDDTVKMETVIPLDVSPILRKR